MMSTSVGAVAIVLALVAGLVPVAGVFLPKAIAPLIICSAILCTFTLGVRDRDLLHMSRAIVIPLTVLCIWALVSSIWANEQASAFTGALHLTGNLFAGFLFFAGVRALDAEQQARISGFLTVGWFAGLAVIAIEIIFRGPIFLALYNAQFEIMADTVGPFWLKTGTAVLIILVWPVMIALRRSWGIAAAAAAFIAVLILAYQVKYLAGVGALALGAVIAGLAYLSARRVAMIIAVIGVVVSLAAPSVIVQFGTIQETITRFDFLPNAARHRIGIWSFTAARIAEHPLLGWGMNASKEMAGGRDALLDANGINLGQSLPLHPHNAVLQLWLELGVVGAAVYCIVLVALASLAARVPNAPLALGQFVSALVIANVSYGIWQAWWIATLWFAVAMSVLHQRGSAADSRW